MSRVKKVMPDDGMNSNVIDLDIFREIPVPTYPLKKAGKKKFEEWCKSLISAGLLTQKSLEHVESLSLATDLIIASISNGGKNMRAATEMQRSAMLKLEKLDADKGIKVKGNQGNNPFAKFGFARRARERQIS